MYTPRRSIRKVTLALLGLALFVSTGSAFADDPPDRVVRLSYMRGDVSFQPAGDDDWVQANLNRPLVTGDKLYTDRDSRVEMEIGAATLRMDQQGSFSLLNIDDNVAQVELTEGILNLHVRRVFEGQSYEVDTPTLAFVINQPGDYRVDIAPNGDSTMVTVFRGSGDVYGENNASYSVQSGQAYRFHDSALRDYEVLDLPRPDDFDSWVDSRNNRYERSVSSQYVSEDVIGYADLDDYGGWNNEPDYGPVWYPSSVEVGWAPYRSGHWSWVDPWGWTWVDNAAWGFAPFHYGRWAYVGNRWGWCPGPRHGRAIYAPALVAFVGGSGWSVGIGGGGPVGWFPLGPRDVYVPWYRASRGYFTNVNVRNTTVINNTYITNVYNNYSAGRPIANTNYAYRQNVAAVTAVSRETFVGARAVGTARVQVNEAALRNANVASRVGIAPTRESFLPGGARARATPSAQTLDRRVIARTAPPARTAPVAARIDAIRRNGEQPLATPQLRQISATTRQAPNAAPGTRAAPQRVQVVGNNATKPQPLPSRAIGNAQVGNRTATPSRNPATQPATPPNARGQTQTPTVQRGQTTTPTGTVQRGQTANDRGLPSSRFAPRNRDATPQNNAARQSVNTPSTGRQTATPNTPNVQRSQQAPRSTVNPTVPNTRQTTTPRSAPRDDSTVPRTRTTQPTNPTIQRDTTPSQPQRTQTPRTERSVQQPQQTYQPRQSSPPPTYQRSAPPQQQQQMQPRSAPQAQPRSAPVPQQQQRQAPQQERRAPPPERKRDDKDKDKDDRGR